MGFPHTRICLACDSNNFAMRGFRRWNEKRAASAIKPGPPLFVVYGPLTGLVAGRINRLEMPNRTAGLQPSRTRATGLATSLGRTVAVCRAGWRRTCPAVAAPDVPTSRRTRSERSACSCVVSGLTPASDIVYEVFGMAGRANGFYGDVISVFLLAAGSHPSLADGLA